MCKRSVTPTIKLVARSSLPITRRASRQLRSYSPLDRVSSSCVPAKISRRVIDVRLPSDWLPTSACPSPILFYQKNSTPRRHRGDFFSGVTGRWRGRLGCIIPGGQTLDVGRILHCPTARESPRWPPWPPLYFRLSFTTHLRYI